ncbi:MAG: diguanylate cyclase [Sporichthyaceae bacterium]|nr:diguanylate cyclase [Sporichthyaceae bacterium]
MAAACDGLTDDLLAAGVQLPSVYLLVGERLRCFAARGYFQVVDGFPREAGVIGSVVASGEAALIPDVRESAEFIAAVPGLLGEACVPIKVNGRVVGAVNAESRTVLPPGWLPILIDAAAALASRIAQLGGVAPESLMQRVARAAVELTGLGDAATVEQRAVTLACELSGMSSAVLARSFAEGLAVTAGAGPLADALRAFSPEELAAMAGWVAAGTSSHFPGGEDVPPAYGFLHRAELRSLAVYPLTSGGQRAGLLLVADGAPHPHRTDVVEALELLGAQTATALGAVTALQEMSRRALEDPLTGCGNFGAFVGDLAAVADSRTNHAVTCVLLDVDHFKAVNDTYGHLLGDRLLQDVVAALRPVVRTGDRLYRLGGDEFAVLATGAGTDDAEDAHRLATRLLLAVRATGATVSVGYATGAAADARTLRASADAALYAAKRAGRDTMRGPADSATQNSSLTA